MNMHLTLAVVIEHLLLLTRPIGFDLEWRVIFRRNAPIRPAATVQLSDEKMILVIQITAMSRKL